MTTSHQPQFAPDEMFVRVQRINARIARDMLTHNTRNRALSEQRVEKYLRTMQKGLWHFTGETIVFDDEGVLNNGQHTLTAISRMPADYEIDLLIVRGVTAQSQQFSDQGDKRTLGQLMSLNGVKNYNEVAAVGKLLHLWSEGLMFGDRNKQSALTSPEIHDWVKVNRPDLEEWVADHLSRLRKYRVVTPGPLGAALRIVEEVSPVRGPQFVDTFLSRNRTDADATLKALDTQLLDMKGAPARDILGAIFLAWNFWSRGKRKVSLGVPRPVIAEGRTKATPRWNESNFPNPISGDE